EDRDRARRRYRHLRRLGRRRPRPGEGTGHHHGAGEHLARRRRRRRHAAEDQRRRRQMVTGGQHLHPPRRPRNLDHHRVELLTMSLDAISRPTDALTTAAVPAELLETIAEAAPALDRGDRQVAEFLPELGRAGLLDLGVAGSDGQTANGTLLDQASVIEAIARHSLSLAFSVWGQRMAIDYLATTGGSFADRHLDRLRRGETIGVSGMAPAFKASVGAGELGLEIGTGTGESGGGAGSLALRGKLAWASNLYPDAVIVSAAYGSADSGAVDPAAAAPQAGPKSIVAFSLSEAGVTVGP